MARANLTLEEQSKKTFYEILHKHNKMYKITEFMIGPEFVSKIKPYIKNTEKQYEKIRQDKVLNPRDIDTIQIILNYWKSNMQYHSALH